MTRIYRFKMVLLNFFYPCKSMSSVLSAVRFWGFYCGQPPTALIPRICSPSVISHQHVVEFFFLFGALIVALGPGFLLLLFFVRRRASFLLLRGGSAGCVVGLRFIGGGKG